MLELSEAERSVLMERFNGITDGFSALDVYDTNDAEPLVTVLERQNVLREDVSAKVIPRADLLANSPEQYDGYFQVPAAID